MRLVLSLFLVISFAAFSQQPFDSNEKKIKVFGDLSVGASSIKGYSLYTDIQFSWGKHNIVAHGCFNSQYGKNAYSGGSSSSFLAPPDLYYNDLFFNVGVLYGRTMSRKRLFASVNLGPAYYSYVDKELHYKSVNWQTVYYVEEARYKGLSINLLGELSFFIKPKTAIGANFLLSIDKPKTIVGFCLNLKYQLN